MKESLARRLGNLPVGATFEFAGTSGEVLYSNCDRVLVRWGGKQTSWAPETSVEIEGNATGRADLLSAPATGNGTGGLSADGSPGTVLQEVKIAEPVNVSRLKPHLSVSQMESYTRCGEAYRRRYLEHEIVPPGIALIQGKSVHEAARRNFEQKMESHADLDAGVVVEIASAAFDAEICGGYLLTPDEESAGVKKSLGAAKDLSVAMADVYAKQIAPDYQPILVEQRIRLTLPNCERDLLGILDLADDAARIVDLKTAGKSKNQAEADSNLQLTYYAAAFEAALGVPASEVRLETIVKTRKVQRQTLVSSRGPADLAVLERRAGAVLTGIKAGVFTPATPGAWWCSPKYCGYYNRCPYVRRER